MQRSDTWRAGAPARLLASRLEGRHCTDWHATKSLKFLTYGDGKDWGLTETWRVEGMTARYEKQTSTRNSHYRGGQVSLRKIMLMSVHA